MLKDRGYDLVDISGLTFRPVNSPIPQDISHFFFYSPRGVQYFFEKNNYEKASWYGVMGAGTAKAFENHTQHIPQYIGSGQAKEAIGYIQAHIALGTRILFVQGVQSLQSVESELKTEFECLPHIAYENLMIVPHPAKRCPYLLFTSPLNARSYFNSYGAEGYKGIWAIGPTTAEFIRQYTGNKVSYPSQPSIENLIQLFIEDTTAD